jgi:glycosyltransferase involved in cell wall biosynthesis
LSRDRLRILFLLTQDLESPSGLGRYWPLARELSRKGHQVRVAALHSNYATLTEHCFEKDGVRIEYVAPMHVRKSGSQKQYYASFKLILVAMRASWALIRAATASPVDIIQVCKPHPMNSIAGLLAQRLRGGVLCVDCDDYEAHSNRFGSGWQRRVVAYFEQHVPRMAKVVTTHTRFMRDKLAAWGTADERIHYISNGVDQSRFSQPDPVAVAALRERLGLRDRRVVAYLGSLSLPSHPVDLLMAAFRLIISHNPETVLLLVGGGEDIDRLKADAQEQGISQAVYFTGRVSPGDVPAYYALAEVTVDPVYDDDAARGRSPLKMFESWVRGVPFVTSPVGERALLAGNPPACRMAEPAGDARALADAIQQVLDDPELAEALRQRGYERVQEYTWENLSKQMEAVYKEALSAAYDHKH